MATQMKDEKDMAIRRKVRRVVGIAERKSTQRLKTDRRGASMEEAVPA